MEGSDEKHRGPLDQHLQGLQETSGHGPIDHTVIETERPGHSHSRNDFAVLDHGLLDRRTAGKDRAVRGIDDGREVVDPEHSEIRDREGRIGHVLG